MGGKRPDHRLYTCFRIGRAPAERSLELTTVEDIILLILIEHFRKLPHDRHEQSQGLDHPARHRLDTGLHLHLPCDAFDPLTGGPTLPGDGGDAGLPAAFKGVWNFVASKLSTGISRVMAAIVADPLAVPDAVVPGTTTGEFTQGTSWTCGNVPTPVDDDETTPTYEYWTDQNSTYLPEPIP